MAALLELRLKRLFYADKTLCRDINLSVGKGERILIVGSTGTGKSSLLNTLNLMNRSYEGEILFGGKALESYKPEELRSRICMVMQEPWLEDLPIQQVLDLPLSYSVHSSNDPEERQKRIRDLFDAFQLPQSYLKQPASQLSGGEKQRIALIRALQLKPEILLLDEISSALDQKTSGIISDCIFKSFTGTVIAISHDPLWHARWQRQWLLEDGKVQDLQMDREA